MPIIHATKPADAFTAVDLAFRQCHYSTPVIFDRSHAISRLVYQKDILGKLEHDLLKVCAYHLSAIATIIYCTGKGERDTDKPHYDEQLIKETEDQEPIIKRYAEVMRWFEHQKYNFEIDEISSLQLT